MPRSHAPTAYAGCTNFSGDNTAALKMAVAGLQGVSQSSFTMIVAAYVPAIGSLTGFALNMNSGGFNDKIALSLGSFPSSFTMPNTTSGGGNFGPQPPLDSTWYQLALTGNGTVSTAWSKSYGSQQDYETITGGVAATGTFTCWFSNDPDNGTKSWPGYLAGGIVYNYPLTVAMLRRQMRQLAPMFPGAVGYVPMRAAGSPIVTTDQITGAAWTKVGAVTQAGVRLPVPELSAPKAFSFIALATAATLDDAAPSPIFGDSSVGGLWLPSALGDDLANGNTARDDHSGLAIPPGLSWIAEPLPNMPTPGIEEIANTSAALDDTSGWVSPLIVDWAAAFIPQYDELPASVGVLEDVAFAPWWAPDPPSSLLVGPLEEVANTSAALDDVAGDARSFADYVAFAPSIGEDFAPTAAPGDDAQAAQLVADVAPPFALVAPEDFGRTGTVVDEGPSAWTTSDAAAPTALVPTDDLGVAVALADDSPPPWVGPDLPAPFAPAGPEDVARVGVVSDEGQPAIVLADAAPPTTAASMGDDLGQSTALDDGAGVTWIASDAAPPLAWSTTDEIVSVPLDDAPGVAWVPFDGPQPQLPAAGDDFALRFVADEGPPAATANDASSAWLAFAVGEELGSAAYALDDGQSSSILPWEFGRAQWLSVGFDDSPGAAFTLIIITLQTTSAVGDTLEATEAVGATLSPTSAVGDTLGPTFPG